LQIQRSEGRISETVFTKKSDFNNLTDEQIIEIETKNNNRPRKKFGFENPIFVMKNYCLTLKLHLLLEFSFLKIIGSTNQNKDVKNQV
jgi:hypothetical protein